MKQEATKINNQPSLFDLDDYDDRSIGDYDWENSELDRMYEQPPPKVKPPLSCLTFRDGEPVGREPPPDTSAILKICQWFREQPNGGIIDLPDVREQIENLLPNLQPPILREHFKSLLPNLENREQNREQNREHKSWLSGEFPAGESLDNQPPRRVREIGSNRTTCSLFLKIGSS
jgi:hypothetical protein